MLIDTEAKATQALIGQLVGVSQQAISAMVNAGKLPADATIGEMLIAYCDRIREQAAGRKGENGELDLVQERAALAKAQRENQELKNAVARGEYAPIGLLADVLGKASSAVVDRFDQLPGRLAKACPDLPDAARTAVIEVVTSARNEWVRSTASLIDEVIDEMPDDEDGGVLEEAFA